MGALLAQDELMALEHPIICSLREKLLAEAKDDKTVDRPVDSRLHPTCANGAVVVLNAWRMANIKAETMGQVYGSKFGNVAGTRLV